MPWAKSQPTDAVSIRTVFLTDGQHRQDIKKLQHRPRTTRIIGWPDTDWVPARRMTGGLFRCDWPRFHRFDLGGAVFEFRNLAERIKCRVGQQVGCRFHISERDK